MNSFRLADSDAKSESASVLILTSVSAAGRSIVLTSEFFFNRIKYTAYCRLYENRLKSPLPNTLAMKQIKIIVEKHSDGYVAYPLGIKGAIVGQGDTYEEALADIKSAIRCYIEIFGKEMLEDDSPVIEAFLTEAEVAI
jgi:predicted RNase H-like HicB family nuclease